MYDRVLIPTDGSEGISKTLEHGLDLAERHDATVHALYVVDRRQYLGAPDDVQSQLRSELRDDGDTAVETVADAARERDVEVKTTVEEGVPYKAILEYAEGGDIDVAVMGTHGRTGRDRLATLGSVTERVVKHAPVPVLVVRIDGEL